mmetsp:Transcript_53477/g.174025  ORF Transcript_53477/g.174025 Transcript_53477/m.174025 type:complete len:342 (-) Transcript_53477:102-1127(-)
MALLAHKLLDLARQRRILASDAFGKHRADGILGNRHPFEQRKELAELVLTASKLHQLRDDVAWRGGRSGTVTETRPQRLELTEVARRLLKAASLERSLHGHDGRPRGQRDAPGLHGRQERANFREVARCELHGQQNFVGALVGFEAHGRHHLDHLLNQVRVQALRKRLQEVIDAVGAALHWVLVEEGLEFTDDEGAVLFETLHGLHGLGQGDRRSPVGALQGIPAPQHLSVVAGFEGRGERLGDLLGLLNSQALVRFHTVAKNILQTLIIVHHLNPFGLVEAFVFCLRACIAEEKHVGGNCRAEQEELGAGRHQKGPDLVKDIRGLGGHSSGVCHVHWAGY